jgi:hypothetical protein
MNLEFLYLSLTLVTILALIFWKYRRSIILFGHLGNKDGKINPEIVESIIKVMNTYRILSIISFVMTLISLLTLLYYTIAVAERLLDNDEVSIRLVEFIGPAGGFSLVVFSTTLFSVSIKANRNLINTLN